MIKETGGARLARIEEKIDGMGTLLHERWSGMLGRVESLEKSVCRIGERVGKLEAINYRQEGGWIAISKTLTIGATAGGVIVKTWEWLRTV